MFKSTRKYNEAENKKNKKKLKDIVNNVIEQKKQDEEIKDLQETFAKTTRFSKKSKAERIIRELHDPEKHQRDCTEWKISIENKCPGYCKRYNTRGCKERCQELLLQEVKKVAKLDCNQPKPKKLVEIKF